MSSMKDLSDFLAHFQSGFSRQKNTGYTLTSMVGKGIYIVAHQGLGDHILCSGLYREYSVNYLKCIVPVIDSYFETVSKMLQDVPNLQVVPYTTEFWAMKMEAHANLLRSFGYDVLKLGHFGSGFFLDPQKRLDANFYDQAGLNLNHRWDSWNLSRDKNAEERLFKKLIDGNEPYIFLHDDESRNFGINQELLPEGIRIIRPDKKLAKEFSFFDYLKIIENAQELHCIESSFAALIESMQFDKPKFAHRYARPEAKSDFRHEFTYRSKWHIYK